MVPAEDQAMVLPWASVMVIIVLLKVALTWAMPELIFLRSRRRGLARVAVCVSFAIDQRAPGVGIVFAGAGSGARPRARRRQARLKRSSSFCLRSAAPCP